MSKPKFDPLFQMHYGENEKRVEEVNGLHSTKHVIEDPLVLSALRESGYTVEPSGKKGVWYNVSPPIESGSVFVIGCHTLYSHGTMLTFMDRHQFYSYSYADGKYREHLERLKRLEREK